MVVNNYEFASLLFTAVRVAMHTTSPYASQNLRMPSQGLMSAMPVDDVDAVHASRSAEAGDTKGTAAGKGKSAIAIEGDRDS